MLICICGTMRQKSSEQVERCKLIPWEMMTTCWTETCGSQERKRAAGEEDVRVVSKVEENIINTRQEMYLCHPSRTEKQRRPT